MTKKPYFYVNEEKIVSIYDTPHILKSIRNQFKKGEKIISFNDILVTYNIDKNKNKSRALLKITDAHIIKPNSFQKMNVKLAVQLLSNSMAYTIRTCITTNELKSNTASDTEDFIDFNNKLFDCLNSRTLFGKNRYNCALTDSGAVKSFLLDALNYFIDLVKINRNGKITLF